MPGHDAAPTRQHRPIVAKENMGDELSVMPQSLHGVVCQVKK